MRDAKGATMTGGKRVDGKRLEIVPDGTSDDTAAAVDHVASLYADVEANQTEEYRATLARLTPFAHELRLWLLTQPWPKRSNPELAQRLSAVGYGRVPTNTVGPWFQRGILPSGRAYKAILELTGWPEAHLLALMGRDTPPPLVPDVWDFLTAKIREAYETAPAQGAKLLGEFEAWRAEYQHAVDEAQERPANGRRKSNGGTGGKGKK